MATETLLLHIKTTREEEFNFRLTSPEQASSRSGLERLWRCGLSRTHVVGTHTHAVTGPTPGRNLSVNPQIALCSEVGWDTKPREYTGPRDDVGGESPRNDRLEGCL